MSEYWQHLAISTLQASSLDEWAQALASRYQHMAIIPNQVKPTFGSETLTRCQEWAIKYPQFTYESNQLGFRDRTFDPRAETAYFGCSITWGHGVPVNARWTARIDHEMGWSSNNLAIPGVSTEEIVTLFLSSLKFMPRLKRVIMLLPGDSRTHTAMFNSRGQLEYHPVLAHQYGIDNFSDPKINKQLREFGNAYYQLSDEYLADKFRQNVYTIKNICEIKNIDLIASSWGCNQKTGYFYQWFENEIKSPLDEFRYLMEDRSARDGAHPGIESHQRLADSYIKTIKQ